MKQSAKSEAYAESLDLERFVIGVHGLPTVLKSEINKKLADQRAKRASRSISQRRK